jgi:hypothetical protein
MPPISERSGSATRIEFATPTLLSSEHEASEEELALSLETAFLPSSPPPPSRHDKDSALLEDETEISELDGTCDSSVRCGAPTFGTTEVGATTWGAAFTFKFGIVTETFMVL